MTDTLEPPREEPRWVDNEPEHAEPPATRIPPHDLEAESGLLGAAMLEADAAAIVSSVPAEAWYSPAHGVIADAVATLVDSSEPVDPVTVWDQVKREGLTDVVGGHQTVMRIMEGCPASNTSAAKRYRAIVLEHHRARTLIAAAYEVSVAAYAGHTDTALGYVEKALDTLGQRERGTSPISDAVIRHMELVEARQSGMIPSIKTGLVDLDRLLGGFRPGCFYVVAARPGMGKSALACQLALNMARDGERVLFATLEMSENELMDRFVAATGRIDHGRIRDGKMSADEYARYHKVAAQLATWPIDILDQGEASLAEIRAEARTTRAGLVILDYLTLVKATGKHGNRQEEVAYLARNSKLLARSLGIPVVALAQLHRGVEARAEKRPILSDLRESGEIENAADGVLMLYRDEYYNEQTDDPGILEISVQKHRHGPKGLVATAFLAEIQAVVSVVDDRNRRVA